MSQAAGDDNRKLPVYLVLDTSGSMSGDPIEALKMGLRQLSADLKSDPQALETVWLSVITFDSSARQVVPLTELKDFQEPQLNATGSTNLADALKLLQSCIDREVRKHTESVKGDWKPFIFLMTDGQPDSGWEKAADDLKKRRPGNLIGCAAGSGADVNMLKRLTETVVKIQDTSPGTLGAFMKWVTASVSVMSSSITGNPNGAVNLPAPPADKGIVIIP